MGRGQRVLLTFMVGARLGGPGWERRGTAGHPGPLPSDEGREEREGNAGARGGVSATPLTSGKACCDFSKEIGRAHV